MQIPLNDRNGQLKVETIVSTYCFSKAPAFFIAFRTRRPLTTYITKLTFLVSLEK